MGNINLCCKNNRFILCCTLGAFIFTTVTPLQAAPEPSCAKISIADINFGIRIEKLIEKTKKYFSEKNSQKLNEVMWDIKHEIEGYTGKKIKIDQQLDRIEKEAKSRGQPIDKAYMAEMRKRFKEQEKRFNYKAMYMAMCIEHDLSYNTEEETVMFQDDLFTDYSVAKKGTDKKEEKELPLRLTLGVTMVLISLFLYVVPLPPCKVAAPYVFETGIMFLIDHGVETVEEKRKDKK